MNALEHFFCSSRFWRYFCERELLPWVVSESRLGDRVLEIGAGYGAATRYLAERAERVTAVEYDLHSALKLKSRQIRENVRVVCGDGARLPFPAETFSSASAILVLHHLKSAEQQDQMLAEAARVLQPGGVLVGLEIIDSWVNQLIHKRSTFTPFSAAEAFGRLTAAGFNGVKVHVRSGGFRFSAVKM